MPKAKISQKNAPKMFAPLVEAILQEWEAEARDAALATAAPAPPWAQPARWCRRLQLGEAADDDRAALSLGQQNLRAWLPHNG